MKVHSLVLFATIVICATLSQVCAKPFYWVERQYTTTRQPLLKKAVSRFNHWFKSLIDAYPSSTWSWREHIYGQTYWDNTKLQKGWYYKGYEDNKRKKEKKVRRPIFNHYDAEGYYASTKPGCQGDDWSRLDKSISEWGKRLE